MPFNVRLAKGHDRSSFLFLGHSVLLGCEQLIHVLFTAVSTGPDYPAQNKCLKLAPPTSYLYSLPHPWRTPGSSKSCGGRSDPPLCPASINRAARLLWCVSTIRLADSTSWVRLLTVFLACVQLTALLR